MRHLEGAAAKGVSPAYFYLAGIYLDGRWTKKDPERAIEYLIKGAAKNEAYCFYELSRQYHAGEHVEKDHSLAALYMKRAAEEGMVQA